MFVYKFCKITNNIRDNNEKNNSSTHNMIYTYLQHFRLRYLIVVDFNKQ